MFLRVCGIAPPVQMQGLHTCRSCAGIVTAPGVTYHQYFPWLAAQLVTQRLIKRRIRLGSTNVKREAHDIQPCAKLINDGLTVGLREVRGARSAQILSYDGCGD